MNSRIKIKLDHLSYRYPTSDRPLLDNINLEIYKGEIIGITGASGEGKSTLLRCINLLERPLTGAIYIDDKDITLYSEKNLRQLRKEIGIIFQDHRLLSYKTVINNIILPLKISHNVNKQTLKKANEILDLVGLSEQKGFYPYQLSGGQKQRVSIARALVQDQNILLCDEITSSLDIKHAHEILNVLMNINRSLDVTIIFVSHDLSIFKSFCHRYFMLKNGKLLSFNDPPCLNSSLKTVQNNNQCRKYTFLMQEEKI